MPRLSVWMVRASLVYLLVGFTLGALLLANEGIPFAAWAEERLLPGHIDVLLFGFVVQLTMGVAWWILPRLAGGLRGSEGVCAAAGACLNLGVWLALLQGGLDLSGAVFAAGRVCEAASALLFAAGIWIRVRATS
jgi:hypothetical protein